MKGKNLLLIGAGVAAVAYLGTKAYNIQAAIAKLSVSNPKIKIALNGLKIVLDITLNVINPGSTDIPFSYYVGTISYTGTKLADFRYDGNGKTVTLKARTATPISFTLNVPAINFITKITQLIRAISQGGGVDTKISVESSVYAAGVDVPVNFLYDLKTQSTVSGAAVTGIGKIRLFKKFKKAPLALIFRRRNKHAAAPQQPAAAIQPGTPIIAPVVPITTTQTALETVAPAAAAHQDDGGQGWAGNG